MKDKIKFDFTDDEKSLINQSLTMFRNSRIAQEESTSVIDEIMLKIVDKRVELDTIDAGIVINALYKFRYSLENEEDTRENVNKLLMSMMAETDKKKLLLRKTRGNARRYY